jgi:hypothetical protein
LPYIAKTNGDSVLVTKEFDQMIAEMPSLLLKLQGAELLSRDGLHDIPQRGVYVLFEDGKPIYVGRSDRLKDRLLEHSRQSSTHNSAPFAFKLAKEKAVRRGIDISRVRNELEKNPTFTDLFAEAKKRVSLMKIRTVQIDSPVMQTLFEVYAALALKTPYNDFDTHWLYRLWDILLGHPPEEKEEVRSKLGNRCSKSSR